VDIGSEAGRKLVEKRGNLFTGASDGERGKAKELEERSKQAFNLHFNPEAVAGKLAKVWDDALWTEESDTCILCGGCNFVCPTCHCFNVEDVPTEQQQVFTRERYWDSCQLGGFTQMAAENTRRTQAERLRQRIFHKFVYIPAKYNGALGCTGCGRCIEVCPAEISITHILERVMKR
jgi:ferredoxin